MYFHACPPLGCSSQESRNFRVVPFTLTCQATSSHHREVPSPEKLNPLLPSSAAPTKPIISHGVSFQPSKQKRSLCPLCSGLAVAPACPPLCSPGLTFLCSPPLPLLCSAPLAQRCPSGAGQPCHYPGPCLPPALRNSH